MGAEAVITEAATMEVAVITVVAIGEAIMVIGVAMEVTSGGVDMVAIHTTTTTTTTHITITTVTHIITILTAIITIKATKRLPSILEGC